MLDRSKPEHTWKAKRIEAQSAAGEVEPKPAAGYACGFLGRASTAEIRVSRRGQHRSPVGGFYHKRQEKVNGFGSFLGPDLQATYRSTHATKPNMNSSQPESAFNRKTSDPTTSNPHTELTLIDSSRAVHSPI